MLDGRHAAEAGVRATLSFLGVEEGTKPAHLTEEQARLRRGLRAKQRQLGGGFDVLVWDAAYEQWHRLLFSRFLAENGLLCHPEFGAPVTLAECEELARDLGEPDGWSVAARFAAEILPGLFRLNDPCVQLRLAPEHRAVLEKIVADLPKEVFAADDSLGWVYQYWQSERKDQVNASEEKIGGADLGTVTQLFTENYMVRFLLENSLGAWWVARHPDSPLIKGFEYLRFDEDGNPAAGSFDGWPDRVAEVTVMDPCCGSGHFLVEAFGMLWRMRAEEEGLETIAAQDAVLADNLFGLELDPRCVQIAMFAVALAAWKQGGGWRELPTPNIACSGIPARAPLEEWTALAKGDERLERALERLHMLFKDADTLGSLIDPQRVVEATNGSGLQRSFDDVDFNEVAPLLEKAAARESVDPATAVLGADAVGIARAATLLSRSYTIIATNVPFLGEGKMGTTLLAQIRNDFPASCRNLASVMLDRYWLQNGSSVAAVMPADLLSLSWHKRFRSKLLRKTQLQGLARIGPSAFATQLYDFDTALIIGAAWSPLDSSEYFEIDGSTLRGPGPVSEHLRTEPLSLVRQKNQLSNPDVRIEAVQAMQSVGRRIGELVNVSAGSKPGQTVRVVRKFWEVNPSGTTWFLLSSSPSGTAAYTGKDSVLMQHEVMDASGVTEYDTVGGSARGRRGVLMSKMGTLRVSLYDGSWFDDNTYALISVEEGGLPWLWTFCQSPDFYESIRAVSNKTAVPVGAVRAAKVDVEQWLQVASEEFPDGLPEPWSDDPTQWLFEGRPEVATEPFQAGVSRLVGYRWPEQPVSDDLDELVDEDGIVCLPAVGGELPATDRLQELLARAYGEKWSPGLVRQLLEQAGSKKKNLADWLQDDFFKHHCKVFSNRPFVWHIWDGRKDGFAALVNYHRLDRACLEKLTYTYLGDWIEHQRADAAEDVAGADSRLAAAQELKSKLEAILEGEKPYDIYIRWKALHEQPIGWEPDLDDGVRLNIRPFVEANILRSKVNIHWKKDRGKNPDGSERHNDLHYTIAEKQQARQRARA